jgi:hypothetical protein
VLLDVELLVAELFVVELFVVHVLLDPVKQEDVLALGCGRSSAGEPSDERKRRRRD